MTPDETSVREDSSECALGSANVVYIMRPDGTMTQATSDEQELIELRKQTAILYQILKAVQK